ncbi:DUF4389 domain-containing protein [Actinomadura rubrisoli]|uniref:DUF4389 domain-containing protein n=1 Tax=Actinomadura rubrisoli TaxID=2530368 RepID=A0A4R4ZUT7_9ACTN|nr:DUF4389 domain-containing protein [Actinomadura rubrisoli]TDD62250.1 DUF4389 domain-containing protein [Actinomadura rubrisoli]
MAETTAGAAPGGEWRPTLDIDGPSEQSRVTVLFRAILLIPQVIVVVVLGIVADIVVIIGWFAALALGRLPDWAAGFLTGYLAWSVRVGAYGYLLVEQYPPFAWTPDAYPVRVEVRPGSLNRLAVLFRIILIIPAAIVSNVVATGWVVAGFVIWLIVLIQGRMPPGLFEATAAVERYMMRVQAYGMLLTSAYPKDLFGDGEGGPRVSATRPLTLSGTARNLMVLFIVLGVLGIVLQAIARASG